MAAARGCDRVFLLSLPDGSLELHHRPRMTAADALQAHPQHWLSAAASGGQSLAPDRELKPSGTYFLHERDLKPSGTYLLHETEPRSSDRQRRRTLTESRCARPAPLEAVPSATGSGSNFRRRSISDRRLTPRTPPTGSSSMPRFLPRTFSPNTQTLQGGYAPGWTVNESLVWNQPVVSGDHQFQPLEDNAYISDPFAHRSIPHRRRNQWDWDAQLRTLEEADPRQLMQPAELAAATGGTTTRAAGRFLPRGLSEGQRSRAFDGRMGKAHGDGYYRGVARAGGKGCQGEPSFGAAGHGTASSALPAATRGRKKSLLLQELEAWEPFDSNSSTPVQATPSTSGPFSSSHSLSPYGSLAAIVKQLPQQQWQQQPQQQQPAATQARPRALHKIASFFARVPQRRSPRSPVPPRAASAQQLAHSFSDRQLQEEEGQAAAWPVHLEKRASTGPGREDGEWNDAPRAALHTFSVGQYERRRMAVRVEEY